jgi:hypothetical protein
MLGDRFISNANAHLPRPSAEPVSDRGHDGRRQGRQATERDTRHLGPPLPGHVSDQGVVMAMGKVVAVLFAYDGRPAHERRVAHGNRRGSESAWVTCGRYGADAEAWRWARLVGTSPQPACCCAFLTILMGGTIGRSGCGSGIVKRGRVTPGGFMACGKREPQSGLLGVPCPMPCHICDLVRLT